MCGIAGMINLSADLDTKRKMIKTMQRRGPDQQGEFNDHGCCLLHCRLSVIAPDSGAQPMTIQWGNRTYTIVYNGELYNTAQVRRALCDCGHTFFGNCDTEVVLRAYIQWGSECLELFNGIYAFAVWESVTRRVFMARDRIGVKPLFYLQREDNLLFASEIKTILAYPGVRAAIDETGIGQIVLLGPGRIPGSGVFKGIEELKPGHYAIFDQGKLQTYCYWKLKDREHKDNFQQTAEMVRYLVTDAITRQMVSDVPLGTFLSGGLDSSIISALCAKSKAQNGEVLDTFSVDYQNNDRYFVPGKFQPNSDNHFIALMQEHIQSNHHTTVLTADNLVDALEDATIARDLPGMADVDFSLLAFCKDIRNDVTVALSGECADEIFGGYPWYRDPQVRAQEGFPWAQNTKYREGFLINSVRKKLNPESFVMDLYTDTIRNSDILPECSGDERRIKEMVNLNFQWFMQTLLDRKDRMSMYNSLEVRVPFCDHRIAEYLYGVPWEFKEYNGKEKGLLRYAMSDLLPEEVLWRKKSPYPKTYDPKYLELVSGKLKELLDRKNAPIFQFVRKEALQSLLGAEYVWPWYGQLMKVPQTIAYMLQINYWLETYQVDILV